jgi:hypothetical protein
MALIPTHIRSIGIPATTGVEDPPVVPIGTADTDAAQQFFGRLGQIGEVVLKQQTDTEVAAAKAKMVIGTAKIEADLAKEDGLVAPTLFDARAKDLYDSAMSGVTTEDGQRAFTAQFGLTAAKSKIQVTSSGLIRKHGELKADLIMTNDAQINMIGKGVSPVVRDVIQKGVMLSIDNAVKRRFLKPEPAAKMKIKRRGDIAKNGIASWVNSTTKEGLLDVYDQMDAGVFTGSNAAQNKADWAALTELEKESIRQRTSRELESLQRLKDKQERVVEKEKKEEQESKYGEVANVIYSVAAGDTDRSLLPTFTDLWEMREKRQIDGGQLKILSSLVAATGEAKTDPHVLLNMQNEIYALAELSEADQKREVDAIKRRMGDMSGLRTLEDGHATALTSLIDKVRTRWFKNSPQSRARVSLKRILGANDPEFKLGGFNADPQAAGRIQRVLNEYDARVGDPREEPWALHKELLQRAQVEIPELTSIPRPIRGNPAPLETWTEQDVREAVEVTATALSTQEITRGAYKASMRLLDEISSIISQNAAMDAAQRASPSGTPPANDVKRRKVVK